MSNPQIVSSPAPPRWLPWTWLGLLWAAIFAIAISGYPNLVDNERRVGGYIMDVVQNGHWAIQQDVTGDIASKPPMLTWIASVAVLCFGRINRFSIYLPSALATLGVTWLLFAVGRKHFGWRAGFIGAFAYLLSYVSAMQVVTARYDGLFAFPVTLAAVAAYRAWTSGRGWTAFWLANTLGTLVKGPLGLILSGGGLIATFWERRSGNRVPLRGSHWLGVALYLVFCGGWFALAYIRLGHGVLDKMLGKELVDHAVKDGSHLPGQGFWEPIWNTFTNFMPWSMVAGVALWRIIKHPAADIEERRFERFLFCWYAVGLLFFSLAAHQRGRLTWPLVPALAPLVGREIANWLKNVSTRKMLQATTALSAVVLLGFGVYHHSLRLHARPVQETLGMKYIADEIRAHVGEKFPITYAGTLATDSPSFAVQFYLSTLRRNADIKAAAGVLQGDLPAFVVVRNYPKLLGQVGTNTALHELLRWPEKGDPLVRLVGNRPKLEPTESVEACLGPTRLRLEHARLERTRDNEFFVTPLAKGAVVTLQNVSTNTVTVGVHWAAQAETMLARKLAPAAVWRVTAP